MALTALLLPRVKQPFLAVATVLVLLLARLQLLARLHLLAQALQVLAALQARLLLALRLVVLVPNSVSGIKMTHVLCVLTKLAVGATKMVRAVSVVPLVNHKAATVAL